MASGDGASGPPRLASFVESWLRALRELGEASPARRAAVLADVQEGSQPTLIYYALLGISGGSCSILRAKKHDANPT